MEAAKDCALYECEQHEEDGIKWKEESCVGLEELTCKKKVFCPFYKSNKLWKKIIVKRQIQFVRKE